MSSRETRSKILIAAQRVFATYGFLGARTTEIAKEAGVSRTMLHYHFQTKEDLFKAVSDRVFENGLSLLQQSMMSYSGKFDNMVSMVVNVGFDVLDKNPDLIKFVLISAMQSPEMLHESSFGQNDQILRMMDNVINEARKQHPELSLDLDAEQLLMNILGMSIIPYLIKDYTMLHSNQSEADFHSSMIKRRQIILDMLQKQLF